MGESDDEDGNEAKKHKSGDGTPDSVSFATYNLLTSEYSKLSKEVNELKKQNELVMKQNELLMKVLSENNISVPSGDPMETESPINSSSFAEITKQHMNSSVNEVKIHNNNNTGTVNNQRTAITQSGNAAIPPIVVEDNGNRQQIWNELRQITDKVTFSPINTKRYRICVTDSIDSYNKILEYVKGNTYTPKDSKPFTLLVRNLEFVDELNEEKIKKEYANARVDVLKASHWSTRAMSNNNRFFWLVQFNPRTDMTKLNNIRLMFNVSVRYEKPSSKLEIMQCRNCKRFEHAKSSCFNEFRCVKCPELHAPGECNLSEASKPYCCNCRKYDHPANSPKCPAYLLLLSRRKGDKKPSERDNNKNSTLTHKCTNASQFTYGRSKPSVHESHELIKANAFITLVNEWPTPINQNGKYSTNSKNFQF